MFVKPPSELPGTFTVGGRIETSNEYIVPNDDYWTGMHRWKDRWSGRKTGVGMEGGSRINRSEEINGKEGEGM